MKRFWLSWYEKSADDHRPLNYPPNEQILGWWKSGERWSEIAARNFAILVAMVQAETEEDAWAAVLKDWPQPDGFEKRFCEERGLEPLSDRFPLKGWMIERFSRGHDK